MTSVSWHSSISSSSTGDCWGRAASIPGWLKGNQVLFGWLHRRTQMRHRGGRSALTTSFPELTSPTHSGELHCHGQATLLLWSLVLHSARGNPGSPVTVQGQGWKLPLHQQVQATNVALAKAPPKLSIFAWDWFAPLAQQEKNVKRHKISISFSRYEGYHKPAEKSPLPGSPAHVFEFSSQYQRQGLAGRSELWAGTDSEVVCTRAVFLNLVLIKLMTVLRDAHKTLSQLLFN